MKVGGDLFEYLTAFVRDKQISNSIGVILRLLYSMCTGVIQKVLPVLSTETLLHIWLSTEYYGFRPSSTAVDTVS